jgi:hypothetical protein
VGLEFRLLSLVVIGGQGSKTVEQRTLVIIQAAAFWSITMELDTLLPHSD